MPNFWQDNEESFMTNIKGFGSDNASGIHPAVLAWIQKVNEGHVSAYGNDSYTAQANELFKQHFGDEIEVFFALNGTGANTIGLTQVLRSTEAIICAQTAHINEHECGSIQNYSGSSLLTLPTPDGKLTAEILEHTLHGIGDEHYVQPKVISITQATECGTIYEISEIKAITQFARQHNLLVHLDGARISNAAVALNKNFKEFTADLGIDIVSFGGTKNGLMGAEAVLFLNSQLAHNFKYLRKQAMQLNSKMRFIAAQFIALFENDLWKQNATHSNRMAKIMHEKLLQFPEIKIIYKPEVNIIFAILPSHIIAPLQTAFPFYLKDPKNNLARFVCSFDTHESEIDKFIETIKKLR